MLSLVSAVGGGHGREGKGREGIVSLGDQKPWEFLIIPLVIGEFRSEPIEGLDIPVKRCKEEIVTA